MIEIYYASNNKIKNYLTCNLLAYLAWDGFEFKNAEAIQDGNDRHDIIRGYYQFGIKPEKHSNTRALEQVLNAFKVKGFFPPKKFSLSVEGDGYPLKYRAEKHGKQIFRVPLNDRVGIEGIHDWNGVEPDKKDEFLTIDWKGKGVYDHEIQMLMYGVSAWIMWPGYKVYRCETRHVPTGEIDDRYIYLAEDMPAYRDQLIALLERMKDHTKAVPTANSRCPECPMKNGCVAYKAAQEDPLDLVVSEPDMTLPEKISYRERLYDAKDFVDKELSRVREELKEELRVPRVIDGTEYYVSNQVQRYNLNKTSATMFCLMKSIEVPTKIDEKLFAKEAEEYIESIQDEAIKALVQEEYDKCWVPQYTERFRSRKPKGN